MKLRPLGERIVIKKVEVEEKTKSGILLGDADKKPQLIAEVVAVSEDILNDENKKEQIKVGDQVVYSEYAGTEVDLDGSKVTVLKLEDILAVVE